MNALRSLFGILQFVCPVEFRREYGAAMRRDFADGLRDELRVHGAFGALVFAFGAYADLLLVAFRECTAMIFRDLLYAVRSLRKTPPFAAIVITTLTLAIAANVTVFSILRGVVLAPLPYPEPGRLVAVTGTNQGLPFSLSLPDFRDLSERARSFESFAAFAPRSGTLTGRGPAIRLPGVTTTTALFDVLGVRPLLGRTFVAADARPGAAATVVISESLWRSAFNADPKAVGKTIVLDGSTFRVLGVVPASVRQPNFDDRELEDVDFWVPLDARSGEPRYSRGAHYFQGIARLRPGIAEASARAELSALFAQMASRDVDDKHFGVATVAASERIVGDVRPLLIAIFAAVAGVLLVACANVANLLLSRAASRDREFAIRTAVGASRGRLVTQLLVETFAFAAIGGVLGSALAALAVRTFVAAHPVGVPRVADIRFDGIAALYTAAIVALCTIVAGAAPALTLSRRGVAEGLKAAGRGGDASRGGRARGALVIAEVALTLALVVSSGLVLRSYLALTSQPLGFDPRGVLVANAQMRPSAAPAVRAFQEHVAARVRALPGVDSVAWSYSAPFTRRTFGLGFDLADHIAPPGESPDAQFNVIEPDYFRTLRQPLVTGRALARADLGDARVCVVNEAFARKFFAGRSPLGKRLILGLGNDAGAQERTAIVGVVGDARTSYATPVEPMVYVPIGDVATPNVLLLIRARPGAVGASDLAKIFASLDPLVAPPRVRTFESYLADDTAQTRLAAATLGSLALVALVLSLAGIYAVVSYGVATRTHEFGVRMALGAKASQVIRSAVATAMRLVAAGVIAGLLVAAFSTRLLANQLYDVAPLDPLTFGLVAATMALAAFAAALVPASRATRVDPAVALRYE